MNVMRPQVGNLICIFELFVYDYDYCILKTSPIDLRDKTIEL